MRVERPDVLCADKKSDGRGDGISWLIFSAVYDDERAEFAGFFVRNDVGLSGRKQDRGEKHAKAGDGSQPTVPKTERHYDKPSARETEEYAEGHPGFGVAADAEKFGNEKNGGEHRADQQIA